MSTQANIWRCWWQMPNYAETGEWAPIIWGWWASLSWAWAMVVTGFLLPGAQSWLGEGWARFTHLPTSPSHRSRLPPRVCCPVPKEEEGGLDLFSHSLFHFTEISYFLDESVNYTRGTIKRHSVITRYSGGWHVYCFKQLRDLLSNLDKWQIVIS